MNKNNPKNKHSDFETTIYQGSSKKKSKEKNKKQKCAVFHFDKIFQGKVRFKNTFILLRETLCKEKNSYF